MASESSGTNAPGAAVTAGDIDMASTTLAVVIKKEPHESAAERFAAVPEAKRQRARSSTPHSGGKYAESCEGQLPRLPGKFSAVAPPPLSPLPLPSSPLTPDDAVFEDPVFHDAVAAPGTPPGARVSLVPLAELSSIMEQFTYMLDANFAKLQAIIVPTVASAVAPLLGQVSDLTQRMEYLERRLNENTYTPPQSWSDQGWTDYGNDGYAPEARQGYDWNLDDDVFDTHEFPPLQPTWAQRAASGAKGPKASSAGGGQSKGKGKGGKPPGKQGNKAGVAPGKSGGKVTPPAPRPAASSSKIRITTLAGARVRLEDLTETIDKFIKEAGPAPEYRLNGGRFGKSYTVEFKGGSEIGATLVRSVLGSLKLADGTWRKLTCPAPVPGEPPVALFLNRDSDPAKRSNDWHFRCLKRAAQKVRPDPQYLCDPRDMLVSLRWRSVVQLVWDWHRSAFKVVWHEAGAASLFSPEDRASIEKDYLDAVTGTPPAGG